jgi:hypothetical protein
MMSNIPHFFPAPIEGEFFYGTLCRWATMTFQNEGQARRKLGFKARNPLIDFEGHWARIFLEIKLTLSLTTPNDSMLQPLYNSFYNSEKTRIIKFDGTFSVRTELAFTHLRFCPKCFRQDSKNIGMAFWKTSHQSPLLMRCKVHDSQLLPWRSKNLELKGLLSAEPNRLVDLHQADAIPLRFEQLTPFQQWLEHLYSNQELLGKYDLVTSIIGVVCSKLELADLAPQAHKIGGFTAAGQSELIESIKSSGYEDFLLRAPRSVNELKDDCTFGILSILRNENYRSPLIYLLLVWTFLTTKEFSTILRKQDATIVL